MHHDTDAAKDAEMDALMDQFGRDLAGWMRIEAALDKNNRTFDGHIAFAYMEQHDIAVTPEARAVAEAMRSGVPTEQILHALGDAE